MSLIEELYRQTRNHPVCQQSVPLESTLSLPVPDIRHGRAYLRFFVYQRGRASKGQPRPVYRPFIRLSIEFPSGRLVEFNDLLFIEGAPATPISEQVGEVVDFAVEGHTFADIVTARKRLFEITETVLQLLQQEKSPIDVESTLMEYRGLLDRLVEPGLYPYYHSLNPELLSSLGER
jgi:hypothetical protein